MSAPLDIAEVNRLGRDAFVERFGDIAEHSPWVAEGASRHMPFGDRDSMIEAFLATVESAGRAEQLALVNAHPDLAGRAAIAGEMAEDSRREQAGAGLDALTPAEFARFTELNCKYRETFGFPFILAVKGATKQIILDAFVERLENDRDTELREALTQVGRIIRFRLQDRVLPTPAGN